MNDRSSSAPKIFLIIEMVPPRKEEDGSITPALVETVRSNLPAGYFDVKVVTADDQTDEAGVYSGATTTYAATSDEFLAKYPFTVFSQCCYAVDPDPRQGKEHEWVISYSEGRTFANCLVMGTPDITEAISRAKQEHPTAVINKAAPAELDQGDAHPMGYLEEYDEILIVGGTSVPGSPGIAPRGRPS